MFATIVPFHFKGFRIDIELNAVNIYDSKMAETSSLHVESRTSVLSKSRANNALVKPKWAVYEVAQNAGRCNKLGMSYKTPLNNKSRKQRKRATSHEESFCKVQFIRVSPKFNLSPALDTMAFLAFVLLLSAQFKLIVPMEKVQLYRFPSGSVYFGNFICNPFRYL